jgi:hypothetical protein
MLIYCERKTLFLNPAAAPVRSCSLRRGTRGRAQGGHGNRGYKGGCFNLLPQARLLLPRRHLPSPPSSPAATRGGTLDLLPKTAYYCCGVASLPMASRPWASLIGYTGRAFRASPARKVARSAVPRPSARHEAQQGTAPRHVVPCLARPGRAVPSTGPCHARLGRPVAHI